MGKSYRETARYGETADTWVGHLVGVDYRAGSLYLFDVAYPRVAVLSEHLHLLRTWGQQGGGPGEFRHRMHLGWMPPYRNFNYLAVGPSRVVVYDGEGFDLFSPTGRHLDHLVRDRQAPLFAFGIRFVGVSEDSSLHYFVDAVDFGDPSSRQLQVWDESRILWTVDLPALDSPSLVARDARPFWVRNDNCQVATDGARPLLFVFNEATLQLDTLQLPTWDVPTWGSVAVDRRPRIQVTAEGSLDRDGTDRPVEPVSIAMWSGLAVDPDGFVWIKKWKNIGEAGDEVYIVNPATGHFDEATLDVFPIAFGRPGTYYGIVGDSDTGSKLIVRYDMEGVQ